MTRPTRRIAALLSVLLLLCGQAVPAFAVCRCDHGDGKTCCDRSEKHMPPAPEPEARACCAHRAPQAPDPDARAYGDSSCRRGLVAGGTSPAAVTPAPEATVHIQPVLAASSATAPEAPATERFLSATPGRGPPPGRTAPLFLLHSSLLS